MNGTLAISVLDRDDDYLGIDIHAANERFAGTARLYAGLNEMTEFADGLTRFPNSPHDERKFEFGTRDAGTAGGFCSLRFHCIDGTGHARVEVVIEDDEELHESASASFGFPVFPAAIDRFTIRLRQIDRNVSNKAELSSND